MPNIPPDTPMSPPFYGIIQFQELDVIDKYWNLIIARLLDTRLEPAMYGMMMGLYRMQDYAPPSKWRLCEFFSDLWKSRKGWQPDGDEKCAEVQRTAVFAVGWVYYDVVEIAIDDRAADATANGEPDYNYAVDIWNKTNARNLQRQLDKLRGWLQS